MDIVERLQSIEYDCCGEGQRCNGELMEEAADEIEWLREALQHILTHCKSDSPPNAQAIILFVNNALEEEE